MTIFDYANNAHTTLATGINTSATSMTVNTGGGAMFPSISSGHAFYCTLLDAATLLVNEIVQVTARSGDVFTVVRAQQSTTAKNWVSGSIVSQLITAGDLANFVQSAQLPSFGTTTYPATFNDSNSGNAPGTTFDGSAARTISANTVGAVALSAFTGSNQSLASSGYQKLPGGLLLQWGQTSDTGYEGTYGPYYFPIAFSAAPWSLSVTPYTSTGAGGADLWAQALSSSLSASQFSVFYQRATSPASPLNGVYWFAIGPA